MIAGSILLFIILLALAIGTYTDFRTREVPDWLNYGIIFTAFVLRIIFSVAYHDYSYIVEGVLGFAAFFLVALAMFYTGQWGGGDSKMLMGLGALIGLELSFDSFLVAFLINVAIFGSLFGISFSLYLAITNFDRFKEELGKDFLIRKKQKWAVWAVVFVLLIASLFVPSSIRIAIATLAGLSFLSFYLFVYLKSVEKSAMIRWVDPEDLTEGDWVVEDIFVKRKRICGPKDLGLENAQIAELIKLKSQKKIKKVLIKYGIPFVPSFLLAFIATYLWGNVIFRLFGL